MCFQNRPKPVEPIDYETYVLKNKVMLHNDPHRELLTFPYDDILIPVSMHFHVKAARELKKAISKVKHICITPSWTDKFALGTLVCSHSKSTEMPRSVPCRVIFHKLLFFLCCNHCRKKKLCYKDINS